MKFFLKFQQKVLRKVEGNILNLEILQLLLRYRMYKCKLKKWENAYLTF